MRRSVLQFCQKVYCGTPVFICPNRRTDEFAEIAFLETGFWSAAQRFRICSITNRRRRAKRVSMQKVDRCHREP
jgi:hypothetical protein